MVKHIILKIKIRIINYYIITPFICDFQCPQTTVLHSTSHLSLHCTNHNLATSANVVNVIMSTRLEHALSCFSNINSETMAFWHNGEVWLLRTGFGIAPMNKLVSLTWLLWALRIFSEFYIT